MFTSPRLYVPCTSERPVSMLCFAGDWTCNFDGDRVLQIDQGPANDQSTVIVHSQLLGGHGRPDMVDC
ncbi:hypothetical protein DPMN_109002 [Dreissena polymorpha]|uniref:Uncharacterized protein n=1 Tax=Dreissena polymorpha TaxID=45954 RepID=A0A9D4K9Y1_DREPO|nr:hypothetical protein DPMN_109002 [Dreissena polymorpha]